MSVCVLLMVFISVFQQEAQSKSKVCANVFCGAGRECAVNEKGEPSCLCIEVRPLFKEIHENLLEEIYRLLACELP